MNILSWILVVVVVVLVAFIAVLLCAVNELGKGINDVMESFWNKF